MVGPVLADTPRLFDEKPPLRNPDETPGHELVRKLRTGRVVVLVVLVVVVVVEVCWW